jgi:hypothetical protein
MTAGGLFAPRFLFKKKIRQDDPSDIEGEECHWKKIPAKVM